jgi:predicted DNA-binding transcriptional regulator AlpA
MEEKTITGNTNAAKYLGCTARTIDNLIKSGDFPEPAMVFTLKTRNIRTWREKDLDMYSPKIRRPGRPKVQ